MNQTIPLYRNLKPELGPILGTKLSATSASDASWELHASHLCICELTIQMVTIGEIDKDNDDFNF